MRLPSVFLLLLVSASAAWAQASSPTEARPPAASGDASPAAASTPGKQPSANRQQAENTRLTWQQRFAQANTTHDGHLTAAQAKGGYPGVARHFQEIDTAHKGYITEDDVRAWHKARAGAHHPRHERDSSHSS